MDGEILNGVLEEFYALCAIPHPSGQETALGDYLLKRLRAMGLSPERDNAGNICCDVPGNREASPVILQAHMDMVAVGDEGYCPETDAIHTQIAGEYLCSDGHSSLGADCGIGLAAALYLLGQDWNHGPLRLICTVEEERGLAGARALDAGWIQNCGGLINLDGFHLERVLVSSAGGLRQTFRRQSECFFPMLSQAYRITLSGLQGGHSGDDIGKGGANGAQCLLWLLQSIQVPYELAYFSAGTTHNAIPAAGEVILMAEEQDEGELQETIDQFAAGMRELYPREEALRLTMTRAEQPQWVLTVDSRDDFLALGGLIQCGIREAHPQFPQVVGASGSLGMLYADGERQEIRSFLRDWNKDAMAAQGDFYRMGAEGLGFSVEAQGYDPWNAREKNPLAALFLSQGKHQGIAMEETAAHVGLEVAVLQKNAPEVPMISVGMDVAYPHSTGERVRLATIAPFVRTLKGCLEAWERR